jgi:uncharacterized protein
MQELKKNAIVSFYGGEPLLQFDLIKKVIEYCNRSGPDINYYMTTNGTLLTDEMIDFIIKNDIIMTFSLDGYKSNHDRNRVFMNDKGSFDTVMKNIIRLQEEKKRRNYTKFISFNCCYDSYTDLTKVIEFFESNSSLFEPYYLIFGQINPYDTYYYEYCDEMYKNGILSESVTAGI